MSGNTYNALAGVLLGGSTISLLVAGAFLIAAIVGWRGPNRRRKLVRFALFTAMFPILVAAQQVLQHWVFQPSLGRQAERARQERIDAVSHVSVGDTIPSFRIKDVDGSEFAIDELRGNVVLLNFFATWCGPCLQELPHIQELWEDNHKRDDFSMLVIGREETDESVAEFRAKHGFSFPIAADPERSVYSLFAEERIPRTYLLSRDGKVCLSTTGFYEQELDELKSELAAQLRSVR